MLNQSPLTTMSGGLIIAGPFLARHAFVRTIRRAIPVMFVCLSVWDGRALWSYSAL